jgi:DNA-binding CsgD family transcriptional regulator
MAVHMPFSDKRYMQLIAEGFSDKECAMKLHIKQSILVNDYLPALLRKAGLSTREEAVIYAKQKVSEEEQKGVSDEVVYASLKGVKMAHARAFYRALERHFFLDDCPGCKSYFQYAVLLVKGQFYQHLGLFLPDEGQNVVELVYHLERTDMIYVHKHIDDELYRVTFVHLQPKEGNDDGDKAI